MPAPEPSVPDGEDRLLGEDRLQSVQCLYCRQWQQVSRRAITLTCKFCSKSLPVASLTINQYQARRTFETCGVMTVEKGGNVFSARVICASLVVRGKIRSDILCHGSVLVSPEAQIRGNVRASTLAVGEGAILEGHYQIGIGGAGVIS